MAERFYCPNATPDSKELTLEGDEARHLSRVRRVKEGELVELFNGEGFATSAEVLSIHKDRVQLRAIGSPLPDRIATISLTLATAVPKGDRFDWLIEKATELGVARLVPIVTERSVVDPRTGKLDRLRRTVIEASKQCGRNRLMTIEPTTEWREFLHSRPANPVLFDPSGALPSQILSTSENGKASVLIGPEGGFSDEEVTAARAEGWTIASLGATLLRVETAGIVACARMLAMADLQRAGERNER